MLAQETEGIFLIFDNFFTYFIGLTFAIGFIGSP